MKLIFLGPPGAGKGTHAALLSEKYGIPHFSTGNLLRDIQKEDPAGLGQEIQRTMREGRLVPDDIVTQLVADAIRKGRGDFILDGFPRNVSQAQKLDALLGSETVYIAVYFETSPETVLQRLTGRRVCRQCGANYHVTNIPPKVAGRCDRCGGELAQREDDREETVRKRMAVYERETEPLIAYYRSRGKLRILSGDLSLSAGQRALDGLLEIPKARE